MDINKEPLGDFFKLFLFLLLFTSLFACQQKQAEVTPLPEKITIAYPQSAYSTLFAVADSKGFFKEEGLEILAKPCEFGRLAVQSMFEKKADMAISGDTVVMFSVAEREKVKVLAEIMTSRRHVVIVAKKGLGIEAPVDLEGKRIGVPMGTTGHFFLASFLSVNGVPKETVKVIYMKPSEMMDAFNKGIVDAVAIWPPFMNQLKRKFGEECKLFYDERIYNDIVCMTTSDDFVEKYPAAVQKVLKALTRAETFTEEYPEKARVITAEFLKLDKTILDEIWDNYYFRVTLDQSLLVSLEDQTRWAREDKLIDPQETPNYLDYIYCNALQSVQPNAVTLIR